MLKNREGHHSDDAVKKGVWIAMWKNCVVHRCVPRCSVVMVQSEKNKGGGENSGEGKTYHKTPPQKRFWTPPLIKVARLQSEFCAKDFFWATKFLTKNAPKFSPKFLSLYSVGQKKSCKIPTIFSLRKIEKYSPTSFCRSAGEPLMVRFPPPLCSRNVILLRGNGHRPGKSHFLGPPKLVLEGVVYSTFSPPPPKIARYVLPPLCEFPIQDHRFARVGTMQVQAIMPPSIELPWSRFQH